MTEAFTYWGEELAYLDHPYNDTIHNERSVEIPIAEWWLGRQHGLGLEVGNVLGHYLPPGPHHRVVDRYEEASGVENIDVFEITGRYDFVISVSSLEHVRWDEEPRDSTGAGQALLRLRGLLWPGGRMLVTIPFGSHPRLDAQIGRNVFEPERQCSFVRDGDGWVQTAEVEHRPYLPKASGCQSVWVAEFAG